MLRSRYPQFNDNNFGINRLWKYIDYGKLSIITEQIQTGTLKILKLVQWSSLRITKASIKDQERHVE